MNKEEQFIADYFNSDLEPPRRWKIQDYIKGLNKEQLFGLFVKKELNWKDLTVRRYLLDKETAD